MKFKLVTPQQAASEEDSVSLSVRQDGQQAEQPKRQQTDRNILERATSTARAGLEMTQAPKTFEEALAPGRAVVNGVKDFVSSANRTGAAINTRLSDLLGFSANTVQTVLNEAGLTEFENINNISQLRELGEKLNITYGPDENPENFESHLGRIVADAGIYTIGILSGGSYVSSANALAQFGAKKATNSFSRFFQNAFESAVRNPRGFLGSETAGVTSSAAGADVLTDWFPESEYAQAWGELIGPGVLLGTEQLARVAADSRPFVSLTPQAARDEVARTTRAATSSEARMRFERMRGMGISPARASGQENLIAMENYMRTRDSELDDYLSDKAIQANAKLTEELRRIPGRSSGDRLRNALENRRDSLVASVDRLAIDASADLSRTMKNIESTADSLTINQAARTSIDKYYDQALSQQREIWGAVDKSASASLDNTRQVLAEELSSRSKAADPSDIPSYVVRLTTPTNAEDIDSIIELTPRQKEQVARLQDQNSVDVRYAQDLRSRILQDIRAEKAKDAPNRNKLRVLGRTQEALLEDLRTSEGQSEQVDSAIAYSRQLNERFHKGQVGKILGFRGTGEAQTAVENTIETVLRGNTVQEVRRSIQAAPEIKPLVADHLRNRFSAAVIKENGTLNNRSYSSFMNRYENVLTEFPVLRTEFEDIKSANKANAAYTERAKKLRANLTNPDKSVAAAYIDNPDAAMDGVLNSKKPRAQAVKLRNFATSDENYLEGLRSTFIERIINKSTQEMDDGSFFTNGRKLQNQIDNYKDVAKIFGITDKDIKDFKRISEALYLNNLKVNQEISPIDKPNTFIDVYARLRGNVLGGKVFEAMGGSGPGAGMGSLPVRSLFAELSRKFAERMQAIPVEKLVNRMLQDEELFEEMMKRQPDNAEQMEQSVQKIFSFFPSLFSDSRGGEEGQRQNVAPTFRLKPITEDEGQ